MSQRKTYIVSTVVLIIFLITSAATFFWDFPTEVFIAIGAKHPVEIAATLVMLVFLGTVVAPLTTIPIIPLATTVLDPLIVAVLTIFGWTLGAVVAFLIARRFGRPLVARFVDMGVIEKYESRIPENVEFLTLVLLRMIVPVDILSYAVGLMSNISLARYTIATAIGITPFTLIFAFAGSAFFQGRYMILVLLVGLSIAVFSLVWHILNQANQK